MRRLVVLLLIVAVGVGGSLWYQNAHQAPTDRILVSGNIELEQVNIGFKTAGRVVERTKCRPKARRRIWKHGAPI